MAAASHIGRARPIRRSEYVPVSDSTLLAVHQFLPSGIDEARADVLLMLDRYHLVREIAHSFAGGRPGARGEWLEHLVAAGFAVVLADLRGTGASFGVWDGPFAAVEARDAHELIEWAARRPWSTGRVGLIGRSYSGIAQYLAASTRPPHLRAMFVEMGMADLYTFAYSGGIFRHSFAQNWTALVSELDQSVDAVPTDADTDRRMLRAAQREHVYNRDTYEMFFALPYRDSRSHDEMREAVYKTRSPLALTEQIGDVPVFHYAGWMDVWTRDALLWRENLNGPRQMVIGPWSHGGGIGEALGALQVNWFRACFGAAGPLARDAAVRFMPLSTNAGVAWREHTCWPPVRTQVAEFRLAPGPTGTVRSINDGFLTRESLETAGRDELLVDPAATTGLTSRWSNVHGSEFGYPDMGPHARGCLTYTSHAFGRTVEIAGHPVVRLWISCEAHDVDVFAYLELVHPDGLSEYLTEGCLRASHRSLEQAPYRGLSLPYHPSTQALLVYGLREPVELCFDMLPIAAIISAGFRLRLRVVGADRDNALALRMPPGAPLWVHRGNRFSSLLELPLMCT